MFTDLRVVGAMEDPNRLVEHRNYGYSDAGPIPGTVVNTTTMVPGPLSVAATDVTLDRLPPAADLGLGFTYTPTARLSVKGTVFNAFNARYYQPDAFFDYEPRLEFLPNPWEYVRIYVSATYTRSIQLRQGETIRSEYARSVMYSVPPFWLRERVHRMYAAAMSVVDPVESENDR
jgi:hypothetical protein